MNCQTSRISALLLWVIALLFSWPLVWLVSESISQVVGGLGLVGWAVGGGIAGIIVARFTYRFLAPRTSARVWTLSMTGAWIVAWYAVGWAFLLQETANSAAGKTVFFLDTISLSPEDLGERVMPYLAAVFGVMAGGIIGIVLWRLMRQSYTRGTFSLLFHCLGWAVGLLIIFELSGYPRPFEYWPSIKALFPQALVVAILAGAVTGLISGIVPFAGRALAGEAYPEALSRLEQTSSDWHKCS